MCPECESNNLTIKPYDYGISRETGYHDAGVRFECRDCGATGDASELASNPARRRIAGPDSQPPAAA